MMSKIRKVDFPQLQLSGENYLTWCNDAELHLTSYDLEKTIDKDNDASPAQKAKSLCFLRRHMMEAMKVQYLTIRDPLLLWEKLKVRYGHWKDVIIPKARHDWNNLRFQDFKSVTEYNSAVHRIVSTMSMCGDKITETDLLEKTLSMLNPSNIVLQRQYKNKKFTTHADLISVLLVAEHNGDLLMKNHGMRPTRSKPAPDVHSVNMRGKGRDRSRGQGRGRDRNNSHGGSLQFSSHGRGNTFLKPQGLIRKYRKQPGNDDKCHNSGQTGHWLKGCLEEYAGVSRRSRDKLEAHQAIVKEPVFECYDFFNDKT